ncbi:MAG TPA: cytidine deaminase [Roseiflexaceae bacterium]|nr:cytidine deaminase [Roseiflexaceae bacterium]HMP38760.1 cytidine deaminase [Roseiflexaceae bacterium]
MTALHDDQQAALIEAARDARRHAYTPYSHFAVGAALLAADGRIFPGCNIENAAYSSTVCAERVALLSAYAAGARDVVALAVVADTPGPVSPCGTCRQVMFELAPHATVILANMADARFVTTPRELLPHGFEPSDMDSART